MCALDPAFVEVDPLYGRPHLKLRTMPTQREDSVPRILGRACSRQLYITNSGAFWNRARSKHMLPPDRPKPFSLLGVLGLVLLLQCNFGVLSTSSAEEHHHRQLRAASRTLHEAGSTAHHQIHSQGGRSHATATSSAAADLDSVEAMRPSISRGAKTVASAHGGPDAASVDGPAAAAVQFAARQSMFDYAMVQGLAVLRDSVQGLQIPEVERTFHVPVLGDFT